MTEPHYDGDTPRGAPPPKRRAVWAWYHRQSDTMRAAVVTAIATVLVALLSPLFMLMAEVLFQGPRPAESDLRLSDVRLVERVEGNGLPGVEVLLHNAGAAPALLKQVRLQVVDVEELDSAGVARGHVAASHEYVVTIPIEAPPYAVTLPVAQQVDAGSSDRFVLRLRSGAGRRTRHRLRLTLELTYDDGPQTDRSLTSPSPLLVEVAGAET